jgi:DNA topoisomerase-1
MKLIIVESPAKSKTIENYLGKEYKVMSSVGHIRDLKVKGKGGFGVDIENNFKPEYRVLPGKGELIKQLVSAANAAERIYLATDPDREGEAISWHLQEVLNQPEEKVSRIVFNEITKTAILNALENPRTVDIDLVHAQESRRILDRIIGFRLSSLLQQRLGSKSAGRVQSVALKLVVDREKEIQAFVREEYWEITAHLKKDDFPFKAAFYGKVDQKIKLNNQEETEKVVKDLENATYTITDITKKNRKRASRPPFITSTLQQDAGAKYNFNAKRVMMNAQKLYEGIDLGTERVGLITYMRTDSTRLSNDFVSQAKDFITEKYGSKYYKGVKQTKKSKNSQDAHEAIRPTNLEYTPEKVKKYLTTDEYKIYSLIYNRALASLMSDAIIEDTKVNIMANDYLFNLNGEKIIFDGYLAIYEETNIDQEQELEKIPELNIGDALALEELQTEQKFTNPPMRYTEARLIRKMEELGIGRPSTYAITMETLRLRSYVTMDKRTFIPTEHGILTSDQLQLYFSSIINVEYTAKMEKILDEISVGNLVWYEELRRFYDQFEPLVEHARDNMVKLYPKPTDEICPECGRELVIRRGPFGEFTACSGYPHCKYIKKEPKKEPVSTGVTCPVCGEGEIVERIANRGRNKGKKFYACSRYPKCKTAYSGIPTTQKCPQCDNIMVTLDDGTTICSNPKCKLEK